MSYGCKVCQDYEQEEQNKKFVLTISPDNRYYTIWCGIDQFNRVISSYFYAEVSTLGSAEPGEIDFIILVMFESFFVISCLLKFLEQYVPEGGTIPVKDILKTAHNYVRGRFIYDFIPLIPLAQIFGMKKFNFIKVMRILTAFAAFDIQYIMKVIIGIRKRIVE